MKLHINLTNFFLLELQARRKIWSPIGDKNNSIHSCSTLNENYTMTSIICPSRDIYFDIRESSNTAEDFINFILASLRDVLK